MQIFKKALPIFEKGHEKEKNQERALRFVVPAGEATLKVAASSIYRVTVNGKALFSGPARAAYSFFCVDRLELGQALTKKENVVVIEVVSIYRESFDYMMFPGFVCAEIERNGEIFAYTDLDCPLYDLHTREKRIQNYGARMFAECYHLKAELNGFYTDPAFTLSPVETAYVDGITYLERRVPYPQYETVLPEKIYACGTANFSTVYPTRDTSMFTDADENGASFDYDTLTERLAEDGLHIGCIPNGTIPAQMLPLTLNESYVTFQFPFNVTGFPEFEVEAEDDASVYMMFDEILSESGDINIIRISCPNNFRYDVTRGTFRIRSFSPLCVQYLKLAVRGKVTLKSVRMVEFKHPPVSIEANLPEHDEELKKIYRAAEQTFLSNAVDVYTDCPSRERAGWLCDSFFTSRVEKALTGESVVERAFLENFVMAKSFEALPDGMLPMCYPGDHKNGTYIPNWAMWFVIELDEYLTRSGDRTLIDIAKPRVLALMDFFEKYENSDGLLEKLGGWVFLEWSRANDEDVIKDINFPTNMLYMLTLKTVAKLYGVERYREKANKLRERIRARSFNGTYFTDNERYDEQGKLFNPGNTTEVCQYYAFFTGTATVEEDKALWQTLLTDFGPERKQTKLHPDVAFANAFIGNYLRLELLYREKEYDKLLANIRGYFSKMADATGTLWENDDFHDGSCNHGFASHVIYWLGGIYGTHTK